MKRRQPPAARGNLITVAAIKSLHDSCQDLIDGITYSLDDPNVDLYRMKLVAFMVICDACRYLVGVSEGPPPLRLVGGPSDRLEVPSGQGQGQVIQIQDYLAAHRPATDRPQS